MLEVTIGNRNSWFTSHRADKRPQLVIGKLEITGVESAPKLNIDRNKGTSEVKNRENAQSENW